MSTRVVLVPLADGTQVEDPRRGLQHHNPLSKDVAAVLGDSHRFPRLRWPDRHHQVAIGGDLRVDRFRGHGQTVGRPPDSDETAADAPSPPGSGGRVMLTRTVDQ